MVRVRRMRAEDVETCARIVAGDPLWRRYGVTLPGARRSFRRALAGTRRGGSTARGTGQIAVAHEGSRVVGFVWFRVEGTFHHSGYVRWIAVAPASRSHGVGERLMRHAEDRMFREGTNVFLTVSDFNTKAQAFYRRLGYTRVGTLADYVVPGITEYLYRKTQGPIDRARGTASRRRRLT
jgi:ribosomal protein S18 acetylase RimI-like enzyme